MKNIIITTIFLAMFVSGSAFADATATSEDGASASANAENSAASSNNGSNVNINFEAEEDTRGIDGPIQTRNEVHYSGEYDVRNVPDVSAPGLTTTLTETCMGSTSGGAAVVGFGFSFGTTWRDNACVRRLDARQLQSIGYPLGAKELMCDSNAVRAALLRAGKPCFLDLPEEVRKQVNPNAEAAIIEAEPVASAKSDGEGW